MAPKARAISPAVWTTRAVTSEKSTGMRTVLRFIAEIYGSTSKKESCTWDGLWWRGDFGALELAPEPTTIEWNEETVPPADPLRTVTNCFHLQGWKERARR